MFSTAESTFIEQGGGFKRISPRAQRDAQRDHDRPQRRGADASTSSRVPPGLGGSGAEARTTRRQARALASRDDPGRRRATDRQGSRWRRGEPQSATTSLNRLRDEGRTVMLVTQTCTACRLATAMCRSGRVVMLARPRGGGRIRRPSVADQIRRPREPWGRAGRRDPERRATEGRERPRRRVENRNRRKVEEINQRAAPDRCARASASTRHRRRSRRDGSCGQHYNVFAASTRAHEGHGQYSAGEGGRCWISSRLVPTGDTSRDPVAPRRTGRNPDHPPAVRR